MRRGWLFILATLAGCAPPALEAPPNAALQAAGFRVRTAESEAGRAALSALPPHRFTVQIAGGQPQWVYPDPTGCRCVYIGDTQAWDRFQRQLGDQDLAAQQVGTDRLDRDLHANPYGWRF